MTSLISFCIPTYNGYRFIDDLLKSLLPQTSEISGIEIIFSDDASTDGTFELLKSYEQKNPLIKVYQNRKNLGMDKNFKKSIEYASGKYVWLSGQDDIFEIGALQKLLDVIKQNKDIGLVYFNYSQKNDDLSKIINPRVITSTSEDMLISKSEPDQFLKQVDFTPSFLPATIMYRKFWLETTDIDRYFDTKYVQMAVFLQNLDKANSYYIADPNYITCRIRDDGWQQDGDMLFDTMTGSFEVLHEISQMNLNKNPIPNDFINRFKNIVFGRFFQTVIRLKSQGLKYRTRYFSRIIRISDNKTKAYFLYTPTLLMPVTISKAIIYCYDLIFKKSLLKHTQ